MSAVTDNAAKRRFELEEQGQLAFADYTRRDGVLSIPHVEAAEGLRGTGAAGRLMEGMLAIVRERGLKVRPICPYAVAFIQRRPEFHDLVA